MYQRGQDTCGDGWLVSSGESETKLGTWYRMGASSYNRVLLLPHHPVTIWRAQNELQLMCRWKELHIYFNACCTWWIAFKVTGIVGFGFLYTQDGLRPVIAILFVTHMSIYYSHNCPLYGQFVYKELSDLPEVSDSSCIDDSVAASITGIGQQIINVLIVLHRVHSQVTGSITP